MTPISIKGWMLPSDINGLLDFLFYVHHLLVKDLDLLPVDLMVASGLVFPDYRFCLFMVSTQSLYFPRALAVSQGFLAPISRGVWGTLPQKIWNFKALKCDFQHSGE